MDSIDSPLVLTKLRLPARRARAISRPRLTALLSGEPLRNIVLVSAPAGYGKTSLLVDWAHAITANGALVTWYALDSSDDDPVSFGSYLVAGLAQSIGPNPELAHVAQVLRTSPAADLQRTVQSLINTIALVERPCVLILDDYHLITSPAIHTALTFLLEHLPENLRVVIGSRSDPPFPLARMRARASLLEMRASDLRFTPDETGQFLNNVMQLGLSAQGAAALETRTEGWAAGLQLAALSLTGREDKEAFIAAFTGSHRYLFEYLLEEVFKRQTPEVQAFLLGTAILERMCPSLCDALLGEEHKSEAILKAIDQANLFVIALDDQDTWYRYHHLFRDFLQTRLAKDQPERLPVLQRKACQWFADHNLLREAARHAFQSQDWEYAAAFVEEHTFTMMIRSEIATLYTWCCEFPEEVMQAHPMLCLMQCWGLVFSFHQHNHAKINLRLRQVEQVISGLQDPARIGELREHMAIIQSFLAMTPNLSADPRILLAQSQELMKLYPEGNPGQFSSLLSAGYACMGLLDAPGAERVLEKSRQAAFSGGLFFGVIESTFQLARLAYDQGRLKHAAELCLRARRDISTMLAGANQELPALGCLDIALAWVQLEQDQLEDAEKNLLHGLELIGMGTNHHYLMTAYVGLVRLYEVRRQPDLALRYISHLEDCWPDIAFYTQGLRVLLALRNAPDAPAARQEALAWCQRFTAQFGAELPAPGTGPYGAADVFHRAMTAWIKACILSGQAQTAEPLLDQLLASASQHAMQQRVIELSVLQALAEDSGGRRSAAKRTLQQALLAAQPEGFVRIFDQAPALDSLLIEMASAGLLPAPLARLFSSAQAPSARAAPLPGMVEELSQREIEVLRLMAQGATNQAIAARLVITVGTVKSHINHILGKLDAHNRTEAVALARKLGLV